MHGFCAAPPHLYEVWGIASFIDYRSCYNLQQIDESWLHTFCVIYPAILGAEWQYRI